MSLCRFPFVDYFYECGLNPVNGLVPLDSDDHSPKSPLNVSFKVKVNNHFPDHIVQHSFDSESTSLVTMPHGTRLFLESELSDIDAAIMQRHSFVITREDGSRVYGVSIIFPEQIDHPALKSAIAAMQTRFEEETPDIVPSHSFDIEKLYSWKAVGLLSRSNNICSMFTLLEDIWCSLYILIPSKMPLESYIYNILFEINIRKSCKSVEIDGIFRKNYIYLPKSIVDFDAIDKDILKLPLTPCLSTFEYSLQTVFEIFSTDDILRMLTCVLLEYRVIMFSSDNSKTFNSVNDYCNHDHDSDLYCKCQIDHFKRFPDFNDRVRLSIEQVICFVAKCLFFAMLISLKTFMIFIVQDFQSLMMLGECISILLQPFDWPHVYAPILPRSLLHFIDAPVPYLMGIIVGRGKASGKLTSPAHPDCCPGIDECHSNRVVDLASELSLIEFVSNLVASPCSNHY